MPSYTTADIRNIALAGHAAAGKTTLAEALLHRLKLIGRAGTVEEGSTVCDFEPEEKHHKHSLNAALINFDHEGRHVNLIDTPGYPDFIGQFLSVIPAVETVAVVIGADRGIQTNTRRVMKAAEERHLPRFIIVNKIDEHVNDLEGLLESIQKTFGPECLPVNLPTPGGKDVIDIWEQKSGAVAFGSVAEAHQKIVEQVVEVDDMLMNTYLEQGENLEPKQLHDAFEKALRDGHLIPVMFCSAKSGAGLDDLLHIIANLCPSPFEGTPAPFLVRQGDAEVEWHPALYPKADPVAHIFKVTTDQFVGKLAMARVHQGTIAPGSSLLIGDSKKPVRIAHIHKVFGKDHKETDSAIPGDIIALAKIDELHFGGVLHGSHDLDSLHFLDVPMPKPMYGLAVGAKSRNDEGKIGDVLRKIADEDPTFKIERNAATHETVCRAMGELHMRMVLEKLHNRFKLDLETKPPKIPYKETITAKAEGHHRHKKQTGGAGQFGEVFLRVEPIAGFSAAGTSVGDSHEDFEFVDDTVGGSIPRQFLPAVEKGVRMVLDQGAVAGYPLTGVRVMVYDGKHHPVDSKEVAFVTAGKRAFIDAISKARPALLEPYVDVEVTCQASKIGDITADFSSKRGQVLSTDMIPGDMAIIHAKVPLAEMGSYSGQLKSITAGQGAFTMNYSHSERTPPNVQADIVAAYKPKHEED
ncbi:MAG: elongation factor G [Planctomycetes bacterium]|nr:elongation factor G [Planctomycetota bacterium]